MSPRFILVVALWLNLTACRPVIQSGMTLPASVQSAPNTVIATPYIIPAATPPPAFTYLVQNQIVTALYVDGSGALYYGVAADAAAIARPFAGRHSLWKKPANGSSLQLTPAIYNLIGGIVVHNGTIYFNEAGNLRRAPDDNSLHPAQVVLSYPVLGKIYGHVNHALVKYPAAGEDALLMAVGSILDSSYDPQVPLGGIHPPYYEPFPTGRILYANFAWLDATSNYEATRGVDGQFDEYARGLRNPWAMTAGMVNGERHVFAVDNDPIFTPEKIHTKQGDANSGDEVEDVQQFGNYGHPYAYAGREAVMGYLPPITVFPNGSVPSGIALAAGKLFVALYFDRMIVQVDVLKHSWRPVIMNIQPLNLGGNGNRLYVTDYSGIRVIDASNF